VIAINHLQEVAGPCGDTNAILIVTKMEKQSPRWKDGVLGILVAFGFYILRNFSFQFDDIWVILDSFLIGIALRWLKPRWALITFAFLIAPTADLPTIYANSSLAMVIGFLSVRMYRKWYFYLLILLIPLIGILKWIYDSEKRSINLNEANTESLALESIDGLNLATYTLSEDTTYFISYWHVGCAACVDQDETLALLQERHAARAFQVLSVYLGDTTDLRFKPTKERYHMSYPNFIDKNNFAQEQLKQSIGPVLMFYKNGKPQKVWLGFFNDGLKKIFMQYYWDYYLGFG
jgi:hypothetical protein